MKGLVKQLGKVLLAPTIVSLSLLTGCGGGGGNSGGGGAPPAPDVSDVTTAQAQQSAEDGLTDGLDVGVRTFSSLSTNSSAVSTVLGSFGLSLSEDDPDGQADTVDQLSQQAQDFLTTSFNDPVRDNNRITYQPNAETVCGHEIIQSFLSTTQQVTDCEALLARVTVVQVVLSADSGTLTYRFDEHEPLIIRYTPTEICYELRFTDLKATIESVAFTLDPGSPADLPETFTGRLETCITINGDDAFTIAMSILDAINIAGTSDGQQVSISLAAKNNVYVLDADALAGTASSEIALAAIDAMFPVDDPVDSAITYPAKVSFSGITGRADITETGNTLTVSNVGLGGAPFTYDVNDQRAIELSMDTFGLTVDGNIATITFDQALNISFSANNVLGILQDLFGSTTETLQGTLAIGAPLATQFTVLQDSTSTDIIKVTSDQVTVVGGGEFTGSSLTLAENSCYKIDPLSLLAGSTSAFTEVVCP